MRQREQGICGDVNGICSEWGPVLLDSTRNVYCGRLLIRKDKSANMAISGADRLEIQFSTPYWSRSLSSCNSSMMYAVVALLQSAGCVTQADASSIPGLGIRSTQ